MSSKVKIAILALLIVGGIGVTIGFSLFNKPHQDLVSAESAFQIDAPALFTAFESDEAGANEKYLNQIVEVSGIVQEKNETDNGGINLILRDDVAMFGINCAFLPDQAAKVAKLEIGMQATVKGICTGYLMDVSLARCVLTD